ncbi:hypothetical protein BJV82DRAFT_663579 [Fennellomyces sp. T-0311]|nr:hypothetical protein BJV82DRAFT_663579 [Fennellomyces sp. T-0311]
MDYGLLRAVTIQMDVSKDHLHETILQTISAFDLTLKVNNDGANADLLLPHKMTQVECIHKEFSNKGQCIYIAIIDDGVDYMHPALGGGFGNGFKVRYGKDMIGVDFVDENSSNMVEDDDPMDTCIAHAQTAAEFDWCCSDAILGMWRALDYNGSGPTDAIVHAMLDAKKSNPDKPDRKDIAEEYFRDYAPKNFARFERLYSAKEAPYLLGSEITYVDFIVYHTLEEQRRTKDLKEFPALAAFVEGFEARSNISKYLASLK